MGTGEFVCVTLRGGAPWGFRLLQNAQDPQHPLQVLEVRLQATIVMMRTQFLVRVGRGPDDADGYPQFSFSFIVELLFLLFISLEDLYAIIKHTDALSQDPGGLSFSRVLGTFRWIDMIPIPKSAWAY